MLAFALMSSLLLFAVSNVSVLMALFPSGDLVFAPTSGNQSVALRIFTISFLASFAAFANGTVRSRFNLGLLSIGAFVVICSTIDIGLSVWVELRANA